MISTNYRFNKESPFSIVPQDVTRIILIFVARTQTMNRLRLVCRSFYAVCKQLTDTPLYRMTLRKPFVISEGPYHGARVPTIVSNQSVLIIKAFVHYTNEIQHTVFSRTNYQPIRTFKGDAFVVALTSKVAIYSSALTGDGFRVPHDPSQPISRLNNTDSHYSSTNSLENYVAGKGKKITLYNVTGEVILEFESDHIDAVELSDTNIYVLSNKGRKSYLLCYDLKGSFQKSIKLKGSYVHNIVLLGKFLYCFTGSNEIVVNTLNLSILPLKEQEKSILEMRFGFKDDEIKSFDKLSENYEIFLPKHGKTIEIWNRTNGIIVTQIPVTSKVSGMHAGNQELLAITEKGQLLLWSDTFKKPVDPAPLIAPLPAQSPSLFERILSAFMEAISFLINLIFRRNPRS